MFRENADVLYAREQPADTFGQSTFDTMFPDLQIDPLSLENDADVLEFFNLTQNPEIEGFDTTVIENEVVSPELAEPSAASISPNSPISTQPPRRVFDKAQLRTAMEKLPICSHCKRRRIKCDSGVPACRNCTKLRKDCRYWDNALAEETSRKYDRLT